MSDKKFLELAAKAAGIQSADFRHDDWTFVYREPYKKNWNPIKDDGDAFRLAVKLGITLIHDKKEKVCAAYWTDVNCCNATYKDDPYAASRRAIVRAAAEIGRKMK